MDAADAWLREHDPNYQPTVDFDTTDDGTLEDDKCNACGEWTQEASDRYNHLYEDGTPLEACQCDHDNDDGSAGILYDLGANLGPHNPFAAQPLARLAA